MGVILLIDDEPAVLGEFEQLFVDSGWDVKAFESVSDARRELNSNWDEIDIAILDHKLTHDAVSGLQFGESLIGESRGRIATALLTAEGDEQLAVDAIKERGFDDYFVKPPPENELIRRCEILQKLADERREKEKERCEKERLEARLLEEAERSPSGRINVDPTIVRTVKDIRTFIAPSLMPVLILGDTGTGKEHMAWEIHEASGLYRATDDENDGQDNFRVVNCGAISETLFLSELFGHVKGSFSDATYHKLGLILEAAGMRVTREMERNEQLTYLAWLEDCCGPGTPMQHTDPRKRIMWFPALGSAETAYYSGTLFFDEVADLSARAQGALLRFLDGYGFLPVGYADIPLAPKLRIVAATNRVEYLLNLKTPPNPRDRTDSLIPGFRTDLLWRLMQWVIWLPALHERDLDDPCLIATDRAKNFGKDVPSRYRDVRFSFASDAVRELQQMVKDQEFSGDSPLKSGNLRNLLGLVDRACWMTMERTGINLQGEEPIQVDSLEITPQILKDAAKQILQLAEHAKTRHKRGAAQPDTAPQATAAVSETIPATPPPKTDSGEESLSEKLSGYTVHLGTQTVGTQSNYRTATRQTMGALLSFLLSFLPMICKIKENVDLRSGWTRLMRLLEVVLRNLETTS